MTRCLPALRCIAASLLASVALAQPAQAQFWGYQYPDGSIRSGGGAVLQGPDPYAVLRQRLTPPIYRRSVDLNTGTIYQGGLMQSGPNPYRRQAICLQLGIC